jgi:hypothetical protein
MDTDQGCLIHYEGIVAWIERRPSFPLLSRFTRRYLDGERSPGVPRPACG